MRGNPTVSVSGTVSLRVSVRDGVREIGSEGESIDELSIDCDQQLLNTCVRPCDRVPACTRSHTHTTQLTGNNQNHVSCQLGGPHAVCCSCCCYYC